MKLQNYCFVLRRKQHLLWEHFLLMYAASRKYMNDKLKFTVYDAPDIMSGLLLLLCMKNDITFSVKISSNKKRWIQLCDLLEFRVKTRLPYRDS